MILDGRNRLRACEAAGIKPRFEPLAAGLDAADYVLDKNVQRRHLDTRQRAFAAAKIATLRQGHSRTGNFAGLPTQAEAAKKLNVGERRVRSARVVVDRGVSELQEAVRDGKVSIAAANEVALLPEEQQRDAVANKKVASVARVAKHKRLDAQKKKRKRAARPAPPRYPAYDGATEEQYDVAMLQQAWEAACLAAGASFSPSLVTTTARGLGPRQSP
jgi:ParB-like chromosome segregation protein Spo0J